MDVEILETNIVNRFPYKELQLVASTDLKQVGDTLDCLKIIIQVDFFYDNLKAVKYSTDFVIRILAEYEFIKQNEILQETIVVFRELLQRLASCNKLEELFPNKVTVFDIIHAITKYEDFCTICANICTQIVVHMIKISRKEDLVDLDEHVAVVLVDFKEKGADYEVGLLGEVVLGSFPMEFMSSNLFVKWLTDDFVLWLSSTNSLVLGQMMINLYELLHKDLVQLKPIIGGLLQQLMPLPSQVIRLAGVETRARHLLVLVLTKFVKDQGILDEEVSNRITQDVLGYPEKVAKWHYQFSETFFWICHWIYYYDGTSVWSDNDVMLSANRLMFGRGYATSITVAILKSVCFIVPLASGENFRKCKSVSRAIVNTLPQFTIHLANILSLTKLQLHWLLTFADRNLKKIITAYWLLHLDTQFDNLRDIFIKTKNEQVLLDLLLDPVTPAPAIKGSIDLLQSLKSPSIFQQLPSLLHKHNEVIKTHVLQALSYDIPKTPDDILQVFCCIYTVFRAYNPPDHVLKSLFKFMGNIVEAMKDDEGFIEQILEDGFLIKYPLSRLYQEEVTKEVMGLLTKIISASGVSATAEATTVDLEPIFIKTPCHSVLLLLNQILRSKNRILKLEDKGVWNIVHKLTEMTDDVTLSSTAFNCLTRFLQIHPELINMSCLSNLVGDKCRYMLPQDVSREGVRFVLVWVKGMWQNKLRQHCRLPQAYFVEAMLMKCGLVGREKLRTYLSYIADIFDKEPAQLDECIKSKGRHNKSLTSEKH